MIIKRDGVPLPIFTAQELHKLLAQHFGRGDCKSGHWLLAQGCQCQGGSCRGAGDGFRNYLAARHFVADGGRRDDRVFEARFNEFLRECDAVHLKLYPKPDAVLDSVLDDAPITMGHPG
ncbi:hypothetical protein PCAR4_350060 [Paraburkholderia caribensis]|nr:hypothetical protein PCAR4_350060 [Paraburkholderia caribensis]